VLPWLKQQKINLFQHHFYQLLAVSAQNTFLFVVFVVSTMVALSNSNKPTM